MTLFDPPEELRLYLARDEAHDHALATARGERLKMLTGAVVEALLGAGILPQPEAARPLVFHVLADALYGNQALNIPPLHDEQRGGPHERA
jgi:hypothetical protein